MMAPAHTKVRCPATSEMPVTSDSRIVFERLDVPRIDGLLSLLEGLERSGESAYFHPHPADRETLEALCRQPSAPELGDEYWVMVAAGGASPPTAGRASSPAACGTVVAYGMLRGWSQGYAVPSLGIAVHHHWRGRGLARVMMRHLHGVARSRKAERIRLKAYKVNQGAIRLYEALGYKLEHLNDEEVIGILELVEDQDMPHSPVKHSPVKRVAISEPDITDLEERNVVAAVRSTWISSSGEFLTRFEREFAAACESRYALAVSNGTTALHLALATLNVGPGDEVIVPSMTYIATANAVRYCGAEPVFVDVDPVTWCLDPAKIEDALTPRTKGIIPVHLLGHPADMDPISEIASMHGLWVVEDAAEAPFASYRGRSAGSLGRIATFSFYGNKVLSSGEGGALTFQDESLEKRMRMLRGQGMDPRRRYYFPIVGYNYRMTNVAAAILCGQMDRRESILQRRRDIFGIYESRLRGMPGIQLRTDAEWATTSPWMFSAIIDSTTCDLTVADLARHLEKEGIETRPMFIPIHTLPSYRHMHSQRGVDLPVTQRLGRDGIMLPTHTRLDDTDVHRICDLIAVAIDEKLATRRVRLNSAA